MLDFNQFDLYSKDGTAGGHVDLDAVWPFYQALIDTWLPGKLLW